MRTDVREATPNDTQLLKAGLKGLSDILEVRYSDTRAADLIRYAASSRSGNMWVCENGGLIAVESANLWSERRNTQICAFWASADEHYDQLLQACLSWFEQRKGSTIIHYEFPNATAADEALLRAGFIQSGSMIIRRKYGPVQEH